MLLKSKSRCFSKYNFFTSPLFRETQGPWMKSAFMKFMARYNIKIYMLNSKTNLYKTNFACNKIPKEETKKWL
jgi:hypothetical protein